jgi:flagellar hook-length control protein FliK
MSQTNIDFLIQAIAPLVDRALSTARTSSDSIGFNDHLSQASVSGWDVARPPYRSDTAYNFSTSDDRAARAKFGSIAGEASTTPDDTTNSSKECASNAPIPPTNSTQPCTNTDESSGDEDTNGNEHHDTDKANDEEAAALLGTTQTVVKEAPVKLTTAHKDEHDSASPAKDITTSQLLAKSATQHKPALGEASTNTEGQGTNAKNVAESGVTVEGTSFETSHAAVGASKTTDEQASAAAKESARIAKQTGKHKTATEDAATAVEGKAEKSSAQAQANPHAATAPGNADDSDSSADDTRRGAKTSTRAGVRNDAVPPANKPDATLAANVIVAKIAAASGNGEVKKDTGDPAVKPVTAKPETAVGPLGRAMGATAEITRGGRSARASETPQVDPGRFVGRVAKAFQTAHERGGTLQLRLSPSELGSLKLQLTVKDGAMSAALETDNANARRVLLDHLPALRDRLAEQNIRIERFDVDVRQENNGGQANPQGSNQNPYQPRPDQSEPRRSAMSQQRMTEVDTPKLQSIAPRISNTEINLIV